jgi:hypothetical protein
MLKLSRIQWAVGSILLLGSIVSASPSVDELPDITGGAIPLLYPMDAPGGGGQLSAGGRLSSRMEDRYQVRVKNQSGDPIEADSLIVVVQKIQEAARLRDVTTDLEVVDADGETEDGKPFFYVPTGGKAELEPYGLSEAFVLEIQNPNMYRLYPPVLRVRGVRLTAAQKFQEALDNMTR